MADINDVISRISESSEFKNMIDDISDNIVKLNTELSNKSSNEDKIELDENLLEEKLGMFLLDKDGNNICDCINQLNNTLKIIANQNKQDYN